MRRVPQVRTPDNRVPFRLRRPPFQEGVSIPDFARLFWGVPRFVCSGVFRAPSTPGTGGLLDGMPRANAALGEEVDEDSAAGAICKEGFDSKFQFNIF